MEDGAIFVSDMEEEELFSYPEYWFKDENYRGYAMRLGGLEYPKGIILHPDTEEDGTVRGWVTYRLDGAMRDGRFAAIIGIDDSMESYSLGSSAFMVDVRRKGEWLRVFESGVLKLGAEPEKVDVKLEGGGPAASHRDRWRGRHCMRPRPVGARADLLIRGKSTDGCQSAVALQSAARLSSSIGSRGVKSRLLWYQARSVPVHALLTAL